MESKEKTMTKNKSIWKYHIALYLPILYLCSLVTVWFLSPFFSLPISSVFSLASPPSWWDKIPVLGLAWVMSSAASSPHRPWSRRFLAPRPAYKYRQRACGHSPPPNSHFAMNSSVTRSCRWRRSSERATPSRAWTLPPSTTCGSSWTASAAQGCRSTRSSATLHLPHSILRIWRSESTIHTTRGEGVGLAWEHEPMPSFHQTTACISLFFECSSRGSILQKLHHTDGTWKHGRI